MDIIGRLHHEDTLLACIAERAFMRKLEGGLEIPAGGSVHLKPGGFHLMFMKLKQRLVKGESHKVTLSFKHAGKVDVPFDIKQKIDAHAH